jgi:hypothetical protein
MLTKRLSDVDLIDIKTLRENKAPESGFRRRRVSTDGEGKVLERVRTVERSIRSRHVRS